MASNSKTNTVNVVDLSDVVVTGVLSVLDKQRGNVWSGTMTELNTALGKVLSRKNSAQLPRSPGALRVVLNRVVNRLRSRSVTVKFGRTTDHTRTRFVKFSTR